MKILMAPVNIAGQPITLVKHLRQRGIDISLLQYTLGGGHKFGYETDKTVNFKGKHRRWMEIETLIQCLEEGYDLYHFWMATFLAGRRYANMFGLDLSFLKTRGKKIIYRTTGFDVRSKSKHMELNPYHPFQYGLDLHIDENMHRAYLDYLRENVDIFIVQDPEMHEFIPEARVIPRAFNLESWPNIGIANTDCPLIVHAPSDKLIKGSSFILKALEDLKNDGYKFRVKLIQHMPHSEARSWYEKADICIDQILIGWYGVFTLECLAMGKPVVVYVRPELYEKFTPRIPIENANPDTIKEKLRLLITDYERRLELSKQARNFVYNVHNVEKVADQLLATYSELYRAPYKPPQGYADLRYFFAQYKKLESESPAIQLLDRTTRYLKRRLPFLINLLKYPTKILNLWIKKKRFLFLKMFLKSLLRYPNKIRKLCTEKKRFPFLFGLLRYCGKIRNSYTERRRIKEQVQAEITTTLKSNHNSLPTMRFAKLILLAILRKMHPRSVLAEIRSLLKLRVPYRRLLQTQIYLAHSQLTHGYLARNLSFIALIKLFIYLVVLKVSLKPSGFY